MIKIIVFLFLLISVNLKADNFTYIKGPQLIESNSIVVSNAGTDQLTQSSNRNIVVTGTTTKTFKLPNTSGLLIGTTFKIINKSTGIVTVNDYSDALVKTIDPDTDAFFQLFTGPSWVASAGGGGGVSDHNDLTNIQGGASSEYYHLDLNHYNAVTPLSTNATVLRNTQDFQLDISKYQYFGDPSTDGSIRVYQASGALITEKRVSAAWVEISRIDNL